MNPRTDPIPGLRQPTAQEKQWVAEKWCPEVQRTYSPNAGKLIRYVGVFFICTSVVNLMRGSEGLSSMIVLLAAAIICLGFSVIGRKSAQLYRNRLAALKQGEYMVAPARSVKVWSGFSGNNPSGHVNVCLADGEPVKGSYQIPYVCAQPLLEQKIHEIPVLLIRIPGDSEILAIPVCR